VAAPVELSGVGKAFRRDGRRTVAFAGVDLSIAAGELVCLLGPSGCGKSTLLRVLAGTLPADAGAVLVGGRAAGAAAPPPRNVLFGPHAQRSRGLDRREDAEIEAEVDAVLHTVGLADYADAYPHELSGGMRHRAAFARAIVTRPSLLLMDEPFGALDALTRMRMHDFLLRMWERYALTILFVTHDLEEAVVLGDRVAVMGGAPASIQQVIEVPLERPRDDADTEAFLQAKRRLRAALGV
jgi:NitT/TauT family transport system ATP-binding protein